MTKKTINFKSKAKYQKWLAYGHKNNLFDGKGMSVTIRGRPHVVAHEKK